MTTIVLAEDHKLVRQGIRALLESEPWLSVVGEAGDGIEAIDLVQRLQPDLLLLDLMMPGLSGLEVVQRVRWLSPRTRVVILSMYANKSYVMEALTRGAAAYVLKDASMSDLLDSLSEVMAGRRYVSAALFGEDIAAYIAQEPSTILDLHGTLTPRERQVFLLAAEGNTASEAAAHLGISRRTLEAHRGNLMRKLGLHSQTELVRYAISRGIISSR